MHDLAKEEALGRIANAMESIAESLSSIDHKLTNGDLYDSIANMSLQLEQINDRMIR